jgi:hypothetical protein
MAEVTQLTALEAAATWRDRALLHDTAVFSDEPVWTMVNLRAVWVAITSEEVDLRRLESLGERLRDQEPAVVSLAAELYWLMYLVAGPACISYPRKTDIVRTIYEWSGQSLPPSHPLLREMELPAEGGPGVLFNARRSSELLFLIKAVVGVKKHTETERQALLHDPWALGRMLDEAAAEHAPQLNHIVRHLLFPDRFEPVFTRRDKRRLVESLGGIPRKEVRRWPVTRLDEELLSIREQLQPLYGDQPLSFLQEPLLSSWRHAGSAAETGTSEQRFWVEKTPLRDRPDRQHEQHGLGRALWAPVSGEDGDDTATVMREIEQGDVVLHLTDNEGITGVSIVSGEMIDDFTCPTDSPFAGQPGCALELSDYIEVTPMLDQGNLLMDAKYQDQLRDLASVHQALFFNRQLTLNRGHFLSAAPEGLIRIFSDFYRQESSRNLPHILLPDPEDLPSAAMQLSDDQPSWPLAQILLGPTGTGKTYHAMVKAVEICDGSASGNHDQLMARYRELLAAERIRLITFHPSFGYREFMEDLVRTSIEDPETGERTASEVVKPGIFRSMAARAGAQVSPDVTQTNVASRVIWKVTPAVEDGTDVDTVYRDLIDGQFITCPEGNGIDFSTCSNRGAISKKLKENKPGSRISEEVVSTIDQLVNQISVDDLIILVDEDAACRAIGRISGSYQSRRQTGPRVYTQVRPVDWLVHHPEPPSWRQIARKKFLPRPLYRLDASLLRTEALNHMLERKATGPLNYVLIIDEIGHGEVATIFGELVTLLDADKRIGASNELRVQLPISGEQFGVPANLYLIGTMNSADPIDPAQRDILNRRFELLELAPDPSLIRGDDQLGTIPDEEGGRIDLRALMNTINRRLEYLAGREQRVGQGFFMQIRTYADLLHAVRSRMLPHLKALFDNDWRKVQLVFRDVLDDGHPNRPQVIGHESLDDSLGIEHQDAASRARYWISTDQDLSPDAFRKIYSGG